MNRCYTARLPAKFRRSGNIYQFVRILFCLKCEFLSHVARCYSVTALCFKMRVFWDTKPCRLVNSYRRFGTLASIFKVVYLRNVSTYVPIHTASCPRWLEPAFIRSYKRTNLIHSTISETSACSILYTAGSVAWVSFKADCPAVSLPVFIVPFRNMALYIANTGLFSLTTRSRMPVIAHVM
jgi:hypothetical protein